MSISLFQAFLMGVVYYLGIIGTPWTTVLGSASLFQAVSSGTLVGLILGHPAEGVIIGAAIQLPYIAFISAGGTIPSDPGLAGGAGHGVCDRRQRRSGNRDHDCDSVWFVRHSGLGTAHDD